MADREQSPRRRGDYSDEEYTPSRGDRFRRERSIEQDRDRVDDYGRSRKRRSLSPTERDHRHKRTRGSSSSPPPRRRDSIRDTSGAAPEGDHYVPNYERDGYLPGPRYGDMPDAPAVPPISFPMMGDPGFFTPEFMGGPMIAGPFFGPNPGNRMPIVDPNQLDYLVTFRLFADHYTLTHPGVRLSDEEMQRRYSRYKEEFAGRQLAAFFEKNKSHEWFMEKYHPKTRAPRLQEAMEVKRGLYRVFIKELEEGKWDDVFFEEKVNGPLNRKLADEDESMDDAREEGEVEHKKDEPQTWKLIIKTVPPSISRQKIVDMCKEVEGFESVILSEPSPNKKFHRIGWITFKEGTDMQDAFDKLDNKKIDEFVFHMAMHRNQPPSRTRAAPEISNTLPRLKQDLKKIEMVTIVCDAELGPDYTGGDLVKKRVTYLTQIHRQKTNSKARDHMDDDDIDAGAYSENENEEDLWEIKKRLDMYMVYLRKVHVFCYYCGGESDSVEELQRKCADFHVRKTEPYVQEETRGTKLDKNSSWAKNLDQKIDLKLMKPEEINMEKLGGKDIDKEIRRFVRDKVFREHEAKFKCGVEECKKAFKGPEFVEKHVRTKHQEQLDRVREDVEFFNNYVRDPNHLLPTTPPNPSATLNPVPGTAGLNIPFGTGPPPGIFPMGSIPPNFSFVGAPEGTPLDQIPRIGFNIGSNWSGDNGRGYKGVRRERDSGRPGDSRRGPGGSTEKGRQGEGSWSKSAGDEMLVDPRAQRARVSYVDLDAPASGDVAW